MLAIALRCVRTAKSDGKHPPKQAKRPPIHAIFILLKNPTRPADFSYSTLGIVLKKSPAFDDVSAEIPSGWQNRTFCALSTALAPQEFPMQMTTALLIVNPCDDEEDNMAMLCCHSDKGDMFLMSRYPDEDELEITLDGEPSTLDGVKVTLSSTLLKIEIGAADADALNGDDVLEISFNPDMVDLDEVVETLTNILDGTGTFINEV
jgi:hypothetical protein